MDRSQGFGVPHPWACPSFLTACSIKRHLGMKAHILAELTHYKSKMQPVMPGRRTADKERAFFVIFSTMIGAVEIARMLPDRAMRKKVLAGARDFLLGSF